MARKKIVDILKKKKKSAPKKAPKHTKPDDTEFIPEQDAEMQVEEDMTHTETNKTTNSTS